MIRQLISKLINLWAYIITYSKLCHNTVENVIIVSAS